jgi:hypothetical protein
MARIVHDAADGSRGDPIIRTGATATSVRGAGLELEAGTSPLGWRVSLLEYSGNPTREISIGESVFLRDATACFCDDFQIFPVSRRKGSMDGMNDALSYAVHDNRPGT